MCDVSVKTPNISHARTTLAGPTVLGLLRILCTQSACAWTKITQAHCAGNQWLGQRQSTHPWRPCPGLKLAVAQQTQLRLPVSMQYVMASWTSASVQPTPANQTNALSLCTSGRQGPMQRTSPPCSTSTSAAREHVDANTRQLVPQSSAGMLQTSNMDGKWALTSRCPSMQVTYSLMQAALRAHCRLCLINLHCHLLDCRRIYGHQAGTAVQTRLDAAICS